MTAPAAVAPVAAGAPERRAAGPAARTGRSACRRPSPSRRSRARRCGTCARRGRCLRLASRRPRPSRASRSGACRGAPERVTSRPTNHDSGAGQYSVIVTARSQRPVSVLARRSGQLGRRDPARREPAAARRRSRGTPRERVCGQRDHQHRRRGRQELAGGAGAAVERTHRRRGCQNRRTPCQAIPARSR